MLKTFLVHYVVSDSNNLIEINLCKNLSSLERFFLDLIDFLQNMQGFRFEKKKKM